MRLGSLTNAHANILLVALVLIVLTGLIPPWKQGPATAGQVSIPSRSIGYSPIFLPPSSGQATIDFGRLFVTWVVICAGAGVALIGASGRISRNIRNTAWEIRNITLPGLKTSFTWQAAGEAFLFFVFATIGIYIRTIIAGLLNEHVVRQLGLWLFHLVAYTFLAWLVTCVLLKKRFSIALIVGSLLAAMNSEGSRSLALIEIIKQNNLSP